MFLRQGQADRVLIVAAESSLHPVFLQCYQRLGVVASPGELVRPMDHARSGFLVSEAAAAICLERRLAEPGEVIVDRYAMGSDAIHLTAIDPAGRTLRRCLAFAQGRQPVELIHAHATGTRLNDPIELAAIGSVCTGMTPPHLFSHKGAIGHTLGAAGLISLVLNVFMHRLGTIPPNTNTTRPLEIAEARIESIRVDRRIRRSLSIAAGFGGATAVVGLQTA
jgi:3-oxoacyl-[acyl-carrier-protein] synthase II